MVREFDLETRQFVAGGFELPEAKTQISWVDADTVYVGTDFGPGSLTDSGIPAWSSAGNAANPWTTPSWCSAAKPRM